MTALTLEELRRKRARDMLAVIDAVRVDDSAALNTIPEPITLVHTHPCAARELEWLAPEVAVVEQPAVRTIVAPHAQVGVTVPFTRTILVAIYTARYYLADGAPGTRDLQVVYGPLQAVAHPYKDLDAPMTLV